MKRLVALALLLNGFPLFAQYTSYFTGNSVDLQVNPLGGVCMMGGASEHDGAMQWFLNQSNGGDILVLRASGSDGYNDYLYSDLGISVNSVETIVFEGAGAAEDAYIHTKINQAEAIWFAGGDQWNYISYWRNSPIDSLINKAIAERNIVIGGTSAGMAILGSHYFSAENGTVTSATALNNPYAGTVTPDSTSFLDIPVLQNTLTDTHYDNPDRKGRHTVFLARILTDEGIAAKGIACNEYTAVCIAPDGMAHVYGEYPSYDEFAYFIQPNCEIAMNEPETCLSGNPLTWNQSGAALKVYRVPGTMTGTHSFNLNTWVDGSGGTWYNWSVENGVFSETLSTAPDCTSGATMVEQTDGVRCYPNPATDVLVVESERAVSAIRILDANGKEQIHFTETGLKTNLDIAALEPGFYVVHISFMGSIERRCFVKL